MSKSYYDSFFNATGDVFKLLLDLEVTRAGEHAADEELQNGVQIQIGVTGDLTGAITYRFPKQTTLEIVRIMSGMDFNELDAFVTSALGEVANIISGNAMTMLSEQQLTCDILPPRVALDEAKAGHTAHVVESTLLQTAVGPLELEVALEPAV